MQIRIYANDTEESPGYEESTYEESQVFGQYRKNAVEMHNKENSWQRMVSMRMYWCPGVPKRTSKKDKNAARA
jgi:hypothetical protein